MTRKSTIETHFSNTADVWKDDVYKSIIHQKPWEYFDKQYRFEYTLQMIPENLSEGAKALDVGCGAGQLIPELKKKGYYPIAIDVSENMLNHTRELCKKLNIEAEVKHGDCENLDFSDDSFDAYIAMGVIEYMDSDMPMLKEIRRVLKPGACAVVTFRNRQCLHIKWRNFFRKNIENLLFNIARLLTGKKTKPFKSISKEHYLSFFLNELKEFDLELTAFKYCHFHFFPYPLNLLLKPIEALIGRVMEKFLHIPGQQFISSTFLVSFRKK